MSNLVFYDLETTGRGENQKKTRHGQWDQILQVGAILCDENLIEKDRFEIKCSLNKTLIPNPSALLVNNLSMTTIRNTNDISSYQLMCKMLNKFKEWGRAIYIGFNSIEFDEEFLRNTFFQNLQNPYFTQINGNQRADALNIARASSVFHPTSLKILDIKKQFSLENLAKANNIDHSNAHDAMADVETTIDICRIIKKKAPELWIRSLETSSKNDVSNYVQDRDILCHHEAYYGKVYTYVTTHIGSYHNQNKAEINLFFDLKRDPRELLDLSRAELKQLNSDSKTKFLRTRRFNRHPIFMEKDYAMSFPQYESIGMNELNQRANILKNNHDFKMKVLDWHQDENENFEQKESQLDPFWEESLYSMGFASNKDKILMEKFHASDWGQKNIISEEFEQEGYKYFAKKIIYEHDSSLLLDNVRRLIERDISKKLISSNTEKWLTIPEAFAAVDDLRDEYSEDKDKLAFLEDYNNNLEEMYKEFESRLLTS